MAASMVDRWIDEVCSATNEVSNVSNISKAIEQGEIEFHVFVEKLGPFLSNSEILLRQTGTSVFVRVLQQLPKDLFKENQVKLIVEFLCQRLKEQHSIIPHVLQGVSAVSSYKRLPNGSVQALLRSMFANVYVPSLLQPERLCIYTTFVNFLEHHTKDVQGLGTEFVLGFIQVLDGERDPRCLLMAFTVVPVIIENFNLGALDEELFEVISCYFPVDFTPSPSDSQLITKSDLAEVLKKSLLATPKFARFCLPLLLEKLDSDIFSAKLDSLEVLIESCSAYGIVELKPFLSAIWTAVRKELLTVKSENHEEYCILAIKRLVEISSTTITETGEQDTLQEFLGEVWKDCKPFLSQPEQKLIHPTSKLLCTLAFASGPAYCFILSRVLPLMIERFYKVQQDSEKVNLLKALSAFLCVKNDTIGEEGNPTVVHRESLLSLLFSLLTNDEETLRQSSLKCISKLIPRHGYLLDRHRNLMREHLISLIDSEKSDLVCVSLKEVCEVFSLGYPDEVRLHIIPILCERLEKSNENCSFDTSLSYLVSLVTHEATTKPIVFKLTKFLRESESEKRITLLLDCAIQIADRHRSTNSVFLYEECVSHVLRVCLQAAYGVSDVSFVWLSSIVISSASRLIQSVVVSLDINCANDLSSSLIDFIVHNRSSPFLSVDIEPSPFQELNENQQLMTTTLLRSVLAHLPRGASVTFASDLVEWLMNLALESPECVTLPAVQTVAALVNKMIEISDLCMGNVLQRVKVILNDIPSVDLGRKAVLLVIWMTKALLLKGHSMFEAFASELVDVLGNDDLGPLAANGFLTIVRESPDVLAASSHSNELPPLLPIIVESLDTEDPDLITTLLCSIRDLFPENPSLFESHLEPLLSALLKLSSFKQNMCVRMIALGCIESLTLLPLASLLAHRQKTLACLKKCLDDHKRLVRRQAVQARLKWFLLGDSVSPNK